MASHNFHLGLPRDEMKTINASFLTLYRENFENVWELNPYIYWLVAQITTAGQAEVTHLQFRKLWLSRTRKKELWFQKHWMLIISMFSFNISNLSLTISQLMNELYHAF